MQETRIICRGSEEAQNIPDEALGSGANFAGTTRAWAQQQPKVQQEGEISPGETPQVLKQNKEIEINVSISILGR